MKNQTFKYPIEKLLFFEMLEKICIKTETYYQFDMNAFKKGNYDSIFSDFKEAIRPNYYMAKRKYIDRECTYNNMATIIRQLCKVINVKYLQNIKYDRSIYTIIYYIYHDASTPTE